MKELLQTYNELKGQSKILEDRIKDLRNQIVSRMESDGVKKVESEVNSATLQRRTRVKYDLEQLEFDLLAQGIPTDLFSTSKVDIKKVEALLAEGTIDIELVERSSTVTESDVLVVREHSND